MIAIRKQFALVFLAGFAILATSLGFGCITSNTLFCDHPFLVALRGLGAGSMAAGFVLWISLCRQLGGKPDLIPLFDLLTVSGGVAVLIDVLFFSTTVHPALMWAGLALTGAALVIGVAAMIASPAYPCGLALRWPEGGEGVPDSHAPALELRRRPVMPDDLTRIEGIGPHIQSILYQAGVVSFCCLSHQSPERLKTILDEYHVRAPVDTFSWAAQARLAAAGDWAGLADLQKNLHRGRAVFRASPDRAKPG
jgi:hypothetical protein